MKDKRPVICIHGYGLRAPFWQPIAEELRNSFETVLTPSLEMDDVQSAIEEVVFEVKKVRETYGQNVILMGHSLGGVLSAMAAKKCGSEFIDALVIIASPFGKRRAQTNKLMKFLLQHRLLPGWAVRSQFFGKNTPKELQKQLFNTAVPESPKLVEDISQPKWFHADQFSEKLDIPVLGIASAQDRIVSAEETRRFTEALNGKFHLFPSKDGIGHDDFTVYPPAYRNLLPVLLEFLQASKIVSQPPETAGTTRE